MRTGILKYGAKGLLRYNIKDKLILWG